MSGSVLVGDVIPIDTEIAEDEHGPLSWVASVDHKQVGLMYIYTALFFMVIGGLEALALRLQLARPNNDLMSPQTFNELFTMHGTTMIFLVVMPVLIGMGNYLLPLMIGARDVAFPRVNAFGFWMLLFGGIVMYYSFITGGAPDAGWFSYPPLALTPYSSSTGVDYWDIGLLLTGIGTVTAGLNFIVTTLTLRAPGMKMTQVPLFVWMMFITSILIILALPALNAALIMLLVDRLLNARFFGAEGAPILWQHFFWAFGHPEVYIMALPAFGMISEVIPVMSRKPIFGYRFVWASSIAIGFLSFGVWAHHMFAVGLWNGALLAFGASSMLIAVPTGVKIFNWIATMHGGRLRMNTALLFCIAFLVQFTIGGASGVTFAVVPIDWATTDTYYVVAHFHYVLFGGSLFGVMAGAYYWFPKMSGRMLSERLGRWNFWLMVIGFNGTFFVQHILGLIGMPRRVASYPDLPWWGALNLISTIGAFILAFSILVFMVNVLYSAWFGKPAGNDPWDAWTLEWLTTSPPPHHNFERVPRVRSRRPLWDIKHPGEEDWRDPEGA